MEYHRPAWVAVDASAITRNVRTLKALTPRGTRFMAVIKADGYGHGALEAAHAARAGGADRFGVATVDEALALRAAGVAEPLQILAEPPAEAAGLLVEHEIIATVTTREFASALSRAAVRAGRPAAYHLKIDTGMNRIGVRAEDVGETVAALRDLPGLVFEGAFTHFATADEPGDWEFLRQRERLDVALGQLRTERRRPPIVHAANSAGAKESGSMSHSASCEPSGAARPSCMRPTARRRSSTRQRTWTWCAAESRSTGSSRRHLLWARSNSCRR